MNILPQIVKPSSELVRQKTFVLAEFMKVKDTETRHVKPPMALDGFKLKRETTLIDNAWSCRDHAVRQLASVRGPRQRYFTGSISLPETQLSGYGNPIQPRIRDGCRYLQRETLMKKESSNRPATACSLPNIDKQQPSHTNNKSQNQEIVESAENENGIDIIDGDFHDRSSSPHSITAHELAVTMLFASSFKRALKEQRKRRKILESSQDTNHLDDTFSSSKRTGSDGSVRNRKQSLIGYRNRIGPRR